MRHVRAPVRVAQEVGRRLGRRAVLLGTLSPSSKRRAPRLKRRSYDLNAGVGADHNRRVKRPKQAGDDDAGDGAHRFIEAAWVGHTVRLKRDIEHVVAVVGYHRRPGRVEATDGAPTGLGEQPHARADRERQHLDGDGTRRAKTRDALRGVDNDHEPTTGGGEHLLAEERSAPTFDDEPRRIDLVGAIDREIERRMGVEVRKWNPEMRRVRGGGEGSWDSKHAQPRMDAGREDVHDGHRGSPGAVADNHAVVDDLGGERGGGDSLVKGRVGSHRAPVCHPVAVPCRIDGIAAGTITTAMGEPDADGGANVLAAFAVGLRPILAQADVDAFRQYLGRWDEVLGDTSALAMQSDAEVRRTMAEMLRRPRQFGLPAWVESVGNTADTATIDPPQLFDPPPLLESLAVEPIDVPATVYDELTLLGGPKNEEPPQGTVCEPPEAWRQTDFVTGTLVEPRGRIPRVMPVGRTDASPRPTPRVPRGFRQLDLPFGQGE